MRTGRNVDERGMSNQITQRFLVLVVGRTDRAGTRVPSAGALVFPFM